MPFTERPADETNGFAARVGLPGGWLGQSGPFLLLAGMGLWLAARWEQIPRRFIVHWSGSFEPDGWAERSLLTVFGWLALAVTVCGGLLLLAWGLSRWARAVSSGATAAELERQHRRTALQAVLFCEYLVAAVFLLVATIPFAQTREHSLALLVSFLLVSTLGGMILIIFLAIRLGPSLAATGRLPDVVAADRTPDSCWKAGLVYYNPADRAVFVAQRIGFGYTLNFARWESWALVAVTGLVPLLIVLALALVA